MSPDDFIAKWQGATLTKRATAQEYFIDIGLRPHPRVSLTGLLPG
ncbi:hypothetical protein [Thiocapsa sp. UBA6158]|jgi:hypothetical protein|nr:hypothetical protein [Thiocapsa sp. UBA6158]